MPFKVKEIFPVVAPDGTDVVILVEVDAVTLATEPLNVITLLVGVELKFVPVMITVAPSAPFSGLMSMMDGTGNTSKLLILVIVTPLVFTAIGPVTALLGTVTVKLVFVAAETKAAVPLK